MKGIILIVLGVFTFVLLLLIGSGMSNATSEASLVTKFKYNNTKYYMYLDDELNYSGNLKITFREGLTREYVSSIEMGQDKTSNDAIQFFKNELGKEIAEEVKQDSLVKDWKNKQSKIVQKLK